MGVEQKVLDTIKEFNKTRSSTLAEFIAEVFKGKFIEIYLGDSYEEISMDQISTSYPAVFCGKVVAAYKECLVLDSVFVNDNNEVQLGNMMFVSERAIRALNQIDGNGIIEDMFLRSRDALKIKKMFIDKK